MFGKYMIETECDYRGTRYRCVVTAHETEWEQTPNTTRKAAVKWCCEQFNEEYRLVTGVSIVDALGVNSSVEVIHSLAEMFGKQIANHTVQAFVSAFAID